MLAVAGGVLVLVAGALGGAKAVRSLPYEPPAAAPARPGSAAAQLAYVHRYWREANSADFGRFDGTDCVNFASRTLLARGWPMTPEWGHSKTVLGTDAYARAWVSSTALAAWLTRHPELAVPVEDDRRDALRVGDLVQIDWDGSGDRDHTGVVSRITRADGRVAVDFAEHSPSTLHHSVDALLAEHAGTGVAVHYWHLVR